MMSQGLKWLLQRAGLIEQPRSLLADRLPWTAIVGPGKVLQKSGLLQRTLGLRGVDVGSYSPSELVALSARLEGIFGRLGTGWALFSDLQRHKKRGYESGHFSWENLVPYVVDCERARLFADHGYLHSQHYLTIVWDPPSTGAQKAIDYFYEDVGADTAPKAKQRALAERAIELFDTTIDELAAQLRFVAREVWVAEDAECLSYIKSTLSTTRQRVRVPELPVFLDHYLADMSFSPGNPALLGDNYLLASTITDYPDSTYPRICAALEQLEVEFRWVNRWIALDSKDAISTLEQLSRGWAIVRKSVKGLLAEAMSHGEQEAEDNKGARQQIGDADDALEEAHAGLNYGYHTGTVIVWNPNLSSAEEQMAQVRNALEKEGFVVHKETLNSEEAWLGSLPGNVEAQVRRPVLSLRNFTHLFPASSIWGGVEHNEFLDKLTGVGTPHLLCRTTGGERFALNLNGRGEVGHTIIAGGTGAGKSVLLNLLALQWRKYPRARVVIFDKGLSARASTLAIGGDMYEPGRSEAAAAFQPVGRLESKDDIAWATLFVSGLYEVQGQSVSPADRVDIDGAVRQLATLDRSLRTLSTLRRLMTPKGQRHADVLAPYCGDGVYAQIFDASSEGVSPKDWMLIEMEHLMRKKDAVVLPALMHLFRRIEEQFVGDPTLLILDEAWLFLQHKVFASRIEEWLRTLRKRNVFVVFATQEVEDAARNEQLCSTITAACKTRIFLPDCDAVALSEQYMAFGLTQAEVHHLADMTPQRDYYYASPWGSRKFQLDLGPVQLGLVAMAGTDAQAFLDEMVQRVPPEQYLRELLKRAGADWAVEAVDQAQAAAAGRSA